MEQTNNTVSHGNGESNKGKQSGRKYILLQKLNFEIKPINEPFLFHKVSKMSSKFINLNKSAETKKNLILGKVLFAWLLIL